MSSRPVIDEATLERECVRLIQRVDRGTYSSATAGSDDHLIWQATVVAVGWMYMELERAVVELESAVGLMDPQGLLPSRPGSQQAALPLITTVMRMIYHGARSRQRSLEGRLARLVPELDRFHEYLGRRSQRRLFVCQPGDDGVLGPEAQPVPDPRQDVGINALLVQADSDLADVAIHTGFPTRMIIARRTHRAHALATHLWNVEEEIFISRSGAQWSEPGVEGLLPLWSGAAQGSQARQMAARHLRGPGGFWSPHPLRTTRAAAGEPRAPGRGVVSPLLNWLLIRGLYRYGFEEMAGQLNDALLGLAARSGVWQSYDSDTGEGLGEQGSAVTAALVLDLVKTPYHYDRW